MNDADALGAAGSLFGGVKDMFEQGAQQLQQLGGGDGEGKREEKAVKGMEEQVQQASQGVMEVFSKVGAHAPHDKKMHDASASSSGLAPRDF
jgi:hypothetical protein